MHFQKKDKMYWGAAAGTMLAVLLLSVLRDAAGVGGILTLLKIIILLCFAAAALAALKGTPWRENLMRLAKDVRHIGKCNDPLFDLLDTALHYDHYNSDVYLKMIATVNDFYQDTEKVVMMAEEGDLERLYHRLDYLEKCQKLPENLNNLLSGFYLSLLASSLLLWNEFGGWIKFIFWLFLAGIGIAAYILVRSQIKGQDGDYTYLVRDYEIKLLREKILEAEEAATL